MISCQLERTLQLPGLPSLFYLVFLLVAMPWAARKTAHRLAGDGPPVPRLTYWRSAVFTQAMMFTLALIVGSSFGHRIFVTEGLSAADIAYGIGVLAACLLIRTVLRRMMDPAELRNLGVYKRAPRTTEEQAWYVAAAIAAGIAEEAAYRGVAWSILWYSLGDPYSSALIVSIGFALAHWNQGWKSGLAILLIALLMHALVALTGTLVIAMVVHAAYDLIAGHLIRRQALVYDAETLIVDR